MQERSNAPGGCPNGPDAGPGRLREARNRGGGGPFPFGTDFTPGERKLLPALSFLKERTATRRGTASAALSAMAAGARRTDRREELARMQLGRANGFREMICRRLLTWALEQASSGDALR
ncbi:hypothetical protein [Paracoccus sp. J39]|uniref:hypothetical protein n=1 Tax=Paracoccus sp. J39 TaxID=935848 RepID=UPI00049066FC|nr:hypothetical protein [Paracoccus sp. J39]